MSTAKLACATCGRTKENVNNHRCFACQAYYGCFEAGLSVSEIQRRDCIDMRQRWLGCAEDADRVQKHQASLHAQRAEANPPTTEEKARIVQATLDYMRWCIDYGNYVRRRNV